MLTYPIKITCQNHLNNFLTENQKEILALLDSERKQKQKEYNKMYKNSAIGKQKQKEAYKRYYAKKKKERELEKLKQLNKKYLGETIES